MASLSTSYWFNATDTLPPYASTPYTPTGMYPNLTKKGMTIYSNPTGDVPQVGCQTNYYTMGPTGTTGTGTGTGTGSTSTTQSLVSFAAVTPPIYQYQYNAMIATFSQSLNGNFPTVTAPNTDDIYSNYAFTSANVFQFLWNPSISGTNEIFQFSNVSGHTGTISAPPVTVANSPVSNSVVSIAPYSALGQTIKLVQGTTYTMIVTFSMPLLSAPTVTPSNSADIVANLFWVTESPDINFSWTPSQAGTNTFTFTNVTDTSGPLYANVNVAASSGSSGPTTIVAIYPTMQGASIIQNTKLSMTVAFSAVLTGVPTLVTGPHGDAVTSIQLSTITPTDLTFNWTPSTAGTGEVFTFTGVTGATGTLTSPGVTVIAATVTQSNPTTVVSVVPQAGYPIMLNNDYIMVATFSQNLTTLNPTVNTPNPSDGLSYCYNDGTQGPVIYFAWTPSQPGTNEIFGFSGVNTNTGTVYAPGIVVTAPYGSTGYVGPTTQSLVSLYASNTLVVNYPTFFTAVFAIPLTGLPSIVVESQGGFGYVTLPSYQNITCLEYVITQQGYNPTQLEIQFWCTPLLAVDNLRFSFTMAGTGQLINGPQMNALATKPSGFTGNGQSVVSVYSSDLSQWSPAVTVIFNLPTLIPNIGLPSSYDQINMAQMNSDKNTVVAGNVNPANSAPFSHTLVFYWMPSSNDAGNSVRFQFSQVSGCVSGSAGNLYSAYFTCPPNVSTGGVTVAGGPGSNINPLGQISIGDFLSNDPFYSILTGGITLPN